MKNVDEGQLARIREKVNEYLQQEGPSAGLIPYMMNEDSRNHIVNIGTNVLAEKWEIPVHAGSFVKALVANDLMETFGRADHINQKAVLFYVILMINVGYIK